MIRTGKSPLNGQVCAENKPSALKQQMRTCRRQRQRAASSRGLTQGVRRDERGMGEGGKSGCRGRLAQGQFLRSSVKNMLGEEHEHGFGSEREENSNWYPGGGVDL